MEDVFDIDFTVNTVEPIVDIDALEVYVIETRQGEIAAELLRVNGMPPPPLFNNQWMQSKGHTQT